MDGRSRLTRECRAGRAALTAMRSRGRAAVASPHVSRQLRLSQTAVRPAAFAPAMLVDRLSPTCQASSGTTPSLSQVWAKMRGSGFRMPSSLGRDEELEVHLRSRGLRACRFACPLGPLVMTASWTRPRSASRVATLSSNRPITPLAVVPVHVTRDYRGLFDLQPQAESASLPDLPLTARLLMAPASERLQRSTVRRRWWPSSTSAIDAVLPGHRGADQRHLLE